MLRRLCCTSYAAQANNPTPRTPPESQRRGRWYLRRQMATICSPCPVTATALLRGPRGYDAGATPQGLCCTCSNSCTGHTERHDPTAALATQISMPQVLHWPQNSAFRKCCTGHADEHAPSAALATHCLLYTSPSPRDKRQSRMPSSA